MYLVDIGEIIAERHLEIHPNGDEVRTLTVFIGIPRRFPDSTDFFVPYKIEGIGSEDIRYAGGIDAVQALQLVMRMMGADLESYKHSIEGFILWEGDEQGDLGFPIAGR